MRLQLLGALLTTALLASPAVSQDSFCEKLRSQKQQVYGFRPSELNREQQERKSKELDAFWNLAESQPEQAAPCLSQILRTETKDGFFLFDVAELLFRLDSSPAAIQVIIESLQRADMKEVDPGGYIRFVIQLARRDVDVVPLADKYLTQEEVDTSLPQHGGMLLDRNMGGTLLYGSLPPRTADQHLTKLLPIANQSVQATIAFLLSLSMTEESLRALQNLETSQPGLPGWMQEQIRKARTHTPVAPLDKPLFSREQVLGRVRAVLRSDLDNLPEDSHPWIAGVEGFEGSAIAHLKPDDLPLVREARRRSITGVSDEALYEFVAWTRIILGIVNRYDLFKEYRIHEGTD